GLFAAVATGGIAVALALLVACGGQTDSDSSGWDDDAADDDTADDDHDYVEYVPLTDPEGRTIIARGANYMGMEFGWFHHEPEDFQRMASWGFNVVRLPIAWSYLEPEPGVWDESYLVDVVEPVVGYAHDAGLMVILDMHQWKWSPCCGGNGAPVWTCADIDGGDIEWIIQADLFWDHPEYLDHLVATWEMVAEFFSGDDRIWAYDLFNEPNAGFSSLPPMCENQLFRPLFVRLIEAIRKHHPEPYVIVEPSIVNSAGLPFVMDPLPYDRIIYSPHLYPGNIADGRTGYWFGKGMLESHIQMRVNEANERGMPLLIGETGIGSAADGAEAYVRDTTELFDEYLVSFTWWCYWRDDDGMGLLNRAGEEKDLFIKYLSRPYPKATAGVLRSFSFDVDKKVFTVEFENKPDLSPEVEIFIPADRHYPNGFVVECSDEEGTYSYSFDEDTQTLTVVCNPDEPGHRITVAPRSG
ncbi:MAG TPA: glycoside hydrolase family 5 protein, partial [Proteobacteria bacterium]|nr:glycoside hydrolase family 5 protein [Pseudomonadota bacterium]